MRSNLLVILASAAIVSANTCLENSLEELVAETACGSAKHITHCLETADLQRLDEIERCYSSNGCTAGAATVEAVWFKKDCQAVKAEYVRRADLKKRATTSAAAAATTSAAASTNVASTSATTTSDSSTTASSTSSDSTASSTTSTSSASTTGTTTTASTTGTSNTCYATSTKTTSYCYTPSGASATTCTTTTTDVVSCASGMICFTATSVASAATCTVRDDTLTTSGLIVAIVFSLAITGLVLYFTVTGISTCRRNKADERRALLADAKIRPDVEAQQTTSFPNKSEAALPLITPGGQRSEQTGYTGARGVQQQHDYFDSGIGGNENSVTPPGSGGAPHLHPGLSALGQETSEARY